jgi:hypothetical protein
MQLVAYGAQDVYLTGNPQITFFKVVYRRHTNFSTESIQQTLNGTVGFGNRVSCTVSRNGDLVSNCLLEVDLPALTALTGQHGVKWVNNVGERLIEEVEVEIGGQRIDKHNYTWMNAWNQLSMPHGKVAGYDVMIGADIAGVAHDATPPTVPSQKLYIPLVFWFNRNPGLALPLIALQYHEVKLNITFASFRSLVTKLDGSAAAAATDVADTALNSAALYVDYIYLDTDERRRFAQVSHEYLIEQVQFTGEESHSTTNNTFRLNFNHPVKELVWVTRHDASVQPFNYTSDKDGSGANFTTSAKLTLNGHDRFSERDGAYFNSVQPFQHHSNSPAQGVNCYSFALKPEDHQPSGTCNMSRIDNTSLKVTNATPSDAGSAKTSIYAVNYNVLRVMGGMGGLAYSN